MRSRKKFELVTALAGGDFACSIDGATLCPPKSLADQADAILVELYGEVDYE
jgi:hypothetical protein